ncbi:MAG: tetratricopeptide repeat protein, partial [Pseudomonadota bacterium]
MAVGRENLRPFPSDTILLLALAGLAALFALTAFATNRYHAHQQSIGGRWYTEGEAQRKSGAAAAAVESFRTALVYSRDNPLYQLRLAESLAASGRADEAWSYLSSLWDREPENSTVNLELGRLAVRRN